MRHGARGMTLLEVMFALLILAVLSAGVISFYFELTARRDRLVLMATQQRDVSLYFDRVESALLSALAVAPDGSAGVKGDATSLTVATRAVQPSFEDGASLADGCVVSFVFDGQGSRCTQSVSAGDASAEEPVLTSVERLRYRYSDGRQWSSSFDSVGKGGLPVAVEVSVWLGTGAGEAGAAGASAGASAAGVSAGDSDVDGSGAGEAPSLEEDFGPLDVPPPEREDREGQAWTPREPDYVRVISIPDAPDWRERSS